MIIQDSMITNTVVIVIMDLHQQISIISTTLKALIKDPLDFKIYLKIFLEPIELDLESMKTLSLQPFKLIFLFRKQLMEQ